MLAFYNNIDYIWNFQNKPLKIQQSRLVLPCWDGCQHGLWFHWPFLSGHAQCRWHTSSCRPAPLCQSAGLCSVHGQPVCKQNRVYECAWMSFYLARPCANWNCITWTSSSLRMGIDLTLYFWRSSLDSGEDMIFLLMCEGALKCLLRFLRREDVTNGFSFMMLGLEKQKQVNRVKHFPLLELF